MKSARWMLLLVISVTCEAASLDIEAAVERALASGELEVQVQAVEEARGRLQQAVTRPNPTLTYDRQDIFDQGAAPGFVQDLVKLEQSIPGGERRAARRARGEQGVLLARQELAAARRRKTFEVRKAFVRALEAQEALAAHRAILERVAGLTGIIDARVTAGESSKYEKARVRLARSQELDAIAVARVESAKAVTELGVAMNEPLEPEVVLEGSLLPESTGEEAVAAGRPEVAVEMARLEQARAEEAEARSERRPQLAAGLGYMSFTQAGLPQQDGYNAVIALGLPVSDEKKGEIRAARARATAARSTRAALEGRIEAEVAGARGQLTAARARLAELERTRDDELEPLLSMAETSYQAGMQTLLELLDAYRLEREYRVQQVRARAAVRLAHEQLTFALGGEGPSER